jgi:hypothetical protein
MGRLGTELEDVFRNNRGAQFVLHREQVSHNYTDRPDNVVKVKSVVNCKNHKHINAFFSKDPWLFVFKQMVHADALESVKALSQELPVRTANIFDRYG